MENLIEKTKKELLEIAKQIGLKGISKLSKAELIEAIENSKKVISHTDKKEEFKLFEKKEDLKLLPKVEDKKLLSDVLVSEGYFEGKTTYYEM